MSEEVSVWQMINDEVPATQKQKNYIFFLMSCGYETFEGPYTKKNVKAYLDRYQAGKLHNYFREQTFDPRKHTISNYGLSEDQIAQRNHRMYGSKSKKQSDNYYRQLDKEYAGVFDVTTGTF